MRLPFIMILHWNALKDKMEIFDIMPRCIYMHMEIQNSPFDINIVSFINVERDMHISIIPYNFVSVSSVNTISIQLSEYQ